MAGASTRGHTVRAIAQHSTPIPHMLGVDPAAISSDSSTATFQSCSTLLREKFEPGGFWPSLITVSLTKR
jgi:hypothetical protein